jgi:hypothetical protein
VRRHKNYVAANITPGFGDYVSSRLFSHFSTYYLTDQAKIVIVVGHLSSLCSHPKSIDRSIDRRPNGASPAIKQPTSSQHQISNARTRAATADALMDQFLLGHSSSSSKICLRHLHPPLPPQSTTGMANLYTDAFELKNQASAAMDSPLTVVADSCRASTAAHMTRHHQRPSPCDASSDGAKSTQNK